MKTDRLNFLDREDITFTKEQAGALRHIINNALPGLLWSLDAINKGLESESILNKPVNPDSKFKTTYAEYIKRCEYVYNVFTDLSEFCENITEK